MRKTSYRELILLKNVLRDEAVSAFAEAAENDDAENYARALPFSWSATNSIRSPAA